MLQNKQLSKIQGRFWRSAAGSLLVFCALVVSLSGLVPQPVVAQTTDPFENMESWYLDGFGIGVFPINGLADLRVEFDGVPGITAADHTHPYPAAIDVGLGVQRNYRLSPSRRWLYVFGNPATGTGTRIYLYEIPPTDGAALVPVLVGFTLPAGKAFEGFFDPADPTLPHLFLAVELSSFGSQRVMWVNLDSHITGFTNNVEGVRSPLTFSPNGIAAFVTYDGTFAGTATSKLIGLCDDSLGTPLNLTGNPYDDLPAPSANAFLLTNGTDFQAQVVHGATQFPPLDLDDCSGVVVPPTGAACLDGECIPDLTEQASIDLGAVWEGPGTTCAGVNCPPPLLPVLELTATGPASGVAQQPVLFSLVASNTGNAAATNVVVTVTVPFSATFDSASAGGVWNSGPRQVVWNLPSLAAAATANLSFSMSADCNSNTLFMNNYNILADNLGLVWGTPSVSVPIQPAGTDPLSIVVSTTTSRTPPLHSFDTVVHTIDITETSGVARDVITFYSSYGPHMAFDAVLDAGTGSVDSTTETVIFTWTGSLPAFGSTQVVIRSRVLQCRRWSNPVTGLNNGAKIFVTNACGGFTALSNSPDLFAVSPPDLHAGLELINGPERILRGMEALDAPILVRPDAVTDMRWVLTNRGLQDIDVATINCDLGSLIPMGSPPFIGTPPANVTWDATTSQIRWSGIIAPGDTMRVEFQVTIPTDLHCRGESEIRTLGGPADCLDLCNINHNVNPVPWPWTNEHLVVANQWGELYRTLPDGSASPDWWTCAGAGYEPYSVTDLNLNPDDSFWIAGQHTVRLDPTTLDMTLITRAYLNGIGLERVISAVEDSVSGVVYIAGSIFDTTRDVLKIYSWDPATDVTALVYAELLTDTPFLGTPRAMRRESNGHLGLSLASGILSLDPLNAAAAVLHTDVLMTGGYESLGMASDGSFLASDRVSGTGTAEVLASVDPVSGVHTVLVPDLNAVVPPEGSYYTDVAAGSGSEVYLMTNNGNITTADLSVGPPGLSSFATNIFGAGGMVYVGGSGGVSAAPELPVVASLSLHANVPNPFNPATQLSFDLPKSGHVQLRIHDVRGRQVATVFAGELAAGRHELVWRGVDRQGAPLASGVYFARLVYGGDVLIRKMLLMK